MMTPLGDIPSSDMAGWLGAIVGFVAIFVTIIIAIVQAKDAAAKAAWSAAMAAYQGYLQLGVDHPRLGAGEAKLLDESERKSYGWYLSALCFAAEQILTAYGPKAKDRGIWIGVLSEQLARHKDGFAEELSQMNLKTAAGEGFATFSPELQALIRANTR
jgi:hypothetical protein